MAYCSQCGAKLEPGAKFCSNCGTPVPSGSQTPSQTPSRKPSVPKPAPGDQHTLQAPDAPGVVTLSSWEVKPERKPAPKKVTKAASPSRKKGMSKDERMKKMKEIQDKKNAIEEGKAAREKGGMKIGCWVFIFIFIIIPLFFYLVGIFSSCSSSHTPPDPGTPIPEPHDGVFVCDRDTLWFNGDGLTVTWHFSQPVPDIGAAGAGQYVFLFSKGAWRYDAAETFRLIDTDHRNASQTFRLAEPASDSQISFYRSDRKPAAKASFVKIKPLPPGQP